MAKTKPRTASPVDMHVGDRIRIRRLQMDMTQTELGEQLGITFQQIQKYEKGTNRVGSGRLMQIANILKVKITYFYDGAPAPKDDTPDDSGRSEIADKRERAAHSNEGMAVIEALATMQPKLRKALVEIARTLASS